MHISLPVGKDNVLMATDSLESLGKKLTQGNNVYISVHPESKEEADRIFNALSADGTIEIPIADQPIFVFTDKAPKKHPKETDKLTFTFVIDGIKNAVRQAKAAAGDKSVTIIGSVATVVEIRLIICKAQRSVGWTTWKGDLTASFSSFRRFVDSWDSFVPGCTVVP